MQLALAADLSTSRWDSIAVDTVSVRGSISDGLAKVDKLYALGAHTTANVSGSFGLTRNRFGELTYKLAVDSLGALNRWIPRQPGAKVAIQPRPQVVRRAVLRARADSARRDRATELQRMIAGNAPPQRAVVNLPKAVPADTLSGSATAAGTLRGNIYQFDLRGRVAGENVVARGNYARAFRGEYSWSNARTPSAKLAVAVDADSLSAMGFAFDTASARLTYESSGGHVEVLVTQGDKRQYGANGDYTLHTDQSELRLADMTFRFDTAFWHMPHPAAIQWGGPGVRVTNFELVNRGNGRIYANGLLPTSGVADFRVDVDNFPVSNIIDIVQTDIDATGVITLHGTMNGTLANPAFKGAYGLVQGTYNGTPAPDLRGTFAYADKQLVTHAEAVRSTGPSMAVLDARLPINLALSGVTGDRLLPAPMAVDLVADSLPLDLVSQFTDYVSQVHGRAVGKVSMRGTLRRPVLVGGLTVDHGEAIVNLTGAKLEQIGATVRMANDTVYVDSIAAWAKGPVRVRGTLAVGNWREPAFNLYLVSSGAELMNNDHATIRIDAGLALTGPFTRPYVSGAATITQGVIYAPEPSGRHLIGAGDPALFNVLDTAMVADRDLFPAASPFMQNLRLDVSLLIHHDTWVRNREANIEIYADDPISIAAQQQAFQLTGVVTTDRGEYSFLGKRFQIKRGSAMFIGTPDLNPTLQITGEYQVQVASRGALNINVIIGGTLKKPKLSLESDAQPPKTQSELLSLLAFGQNTTSLIASSSSSIAGSAATLDLFGVGAQMAVRRLASVAVGVMVDNVQVQASRGLGTDVFEITPADIPTEALTGNGLSSFFTQTKIEAGKYINPRTFVSGQEQAGRIGLAIEHRTADGWRFSASWEPRVLLREPSLDLSKPNFDTRQGIGGFVIREWRF
jgi:translocation and assembly module TamB